MIQQHKIQSVVHLFQNKLSNSLVGIYLHGSMAMGCFNPNLSDIDLLVIVKDKSSVNTYKSIAKELILIEDELQTAKGFELSVVLEAHILDFIYPTPFEFHYSAFHKEKYKTDNNYFCGGFNDSDLAAHFVVTYHRGVVLCGKPIKEVFRPVSKQIFIDSIKNDLYDALEGIFDNPVYYVLNICRALHFLKESVISSKREGGEWAVTNVPIEYVDVVTQCLSKYDSKINELRLNEQQLIRFARYMLNEIEEILKGSDS